MKRFRLVPLSCAALLAVLTVAPAQARTLPAKTGETVAFAFQSPGGPMNLAVVNALTGRIVVSQQLPQSQNGSLNYADMVASPATKLIYITLESVGYSSVVALNPATGTIANFFALPGGDSAWQLALNKAGTTLYVGGALNDYIVNASTGALEAEAQALGNFPEQGYHLLAASSSDLFFPFGSGYSVADAKTFKYKYQVDVGVTPLALGLSPDQKTLYSAEYSEAAYAVDIAKRSVEETIALGTLPSDMVPDIADHLLYVGVPAGIDVVDVETGAIAGTITGVGAPLNLAFDPATRVCFAATSTGLWRIDPLTFKTRQLFASASFSVQGVSEVY